MKLSHRMVTTVCLILFSFNSAGAELPLLIPRDILFGNPEKSYPQISPDGKYLAYLAPDKKEVMQLWIRTMGQSDDRMITADKKRGIHRYTWAYDREQILYLKDRDGDENWHVIAANIKTNVSRDLTPFEDREADLIGLDPKFPTQMLIGLNLTDPERYDVYRVNIKTGAIEFDTENPGKVIDWAADNNFKVRAAAATTSSGGFEFLYRDAVDQPWKTLRRLDAGEEGRVVGLSLDGKTVYAVSNQNANAKRVIGIEVQTGKEAIIAEDPTYDVGSGQFGKEGILIHPTKRHIQAVAFNREKMEWEVLDRSLAADFEVLRKAHKGEISIVNRDLADQNWIVAYTTDDGPVRYYSYNRTTKSGTGLFSNQPALEGLTLAEMKPVRYEARDGLTIHGYLTLPPGLPPKNLPTVLLVHGGPWARDSWGFNPQAQWLANRGYAVLMINYRGSSGYGKQFLNAGDREWGGKMLDDLIDGLHWIAQQGIADKNKIAIMGRSYGGYAVLSALAFAPGLFAAGVDIVGPSNLISLLKSIPPHFSSVRSVHYHRVGDPDKDAEFLKSRSPLFSAERIKAPLLVIQGANDPRVKKSESEQMVEALRKVGKQVDYILYENEGHYFLREENRLHLNTAIEGFLAKHLGGRLEPAGEIKGHSAVVK